MKRAVLISREPVEGLRLASRLAASGQTVTAVLLDAAAALTRPGHAQLEVIARAVEAGVDVGAHDEALERRGIAEPADGVRVMDLDALADLVADGAERVVWT